MNIYLGNLTIKEIEKRIGIDFPEETREYLKNNHQPEAANIKKGKWHCFDMPFMMVCGDLETARMIFESVKDRISEVKEPLKITYS